MFANLVLTILIIYGSKEAMAFE